MYCNRKCNPVFMASCRRLVAHPLGATNDIVSVACQSCRKQFSTKVKNVKRGGGLYCGRSCNPNYAPRFTRQVVTRRANLKKYGLNMDQYAAMVAAQDNRCAICGDRPSGVGRFGSLVIDHDHDTGAVRGLLCSSCNRALGWFRDDPEIVRRALAYSVIHVDAHTTKQGVLENA